MAVCVCSGGCDDEDDDEAKAVEVERGEQGGEGKGEEALGKTNHALLMKEEQARTNKQGATSDERKRAVFKHP